MAESRLDAYREEIATLLGQGVSQAEVMRVLKERYGVEVRRSTLSDYAKTLPEGESRAGLDGGSVAVARMPPLADDAPTRAVMQSAGEELVSRMGDVIEGMQQLKRDGEDTSRLVRETLERHTRAFDTLHGTFRGAVLGRIWLRTFLVSGCLWGIGLGAFHLYRWGLPRWASWTALAAWASKLW